MAGLDTSLATLGVDSSTHDALIKATLDAVGVARGQLDPSFVYFEGWGGGLDVWHSCNSRG